MNKNPQIEIANCLECPHHRVISDPDPSDWFNDDDQAVVCIKAKNEKQDRNSKYVADRQEFACVTVSCRPHHLKQEAVIPKWCPLMIEAQTEIELHI